MKELLTNIKSFYEEAFRQLNGKSKLPEIDVIFYPYVGINHTIRVRDGKVYVRLAEICREVPLDAHQSLAFILVSKLLRVKIPRRISDVYRNSLKNQEILDRATQNKIKNGRKIITSPRGAVYDLEEIFTHLNQIYFDEAISKPILGWSQRRTYRILGHHDAAHQTIVVSKSLDSEKVPKYVVEFIVYHEMLHVLFPTEHRGGRRYNHTPRFRRREREFAFFSEAESWIERNLKKLKKEAARK